MIKIIRPEEFKQISWKNGKGVTSELAINNGGKLQHFDWRISIASVTESGPFSDFSGYLRNLILISGNGIDLVHNEKNKDKLNNILDFATFPGENSTKGNLHDGPIEDFNVMTRQNLFNPRIFTWTKKQNFDLKLGQENFVYCLKGEMHLNSIDLPSDILLPEKHLAYIPSSKLNLVHIQGQNAITVALDELE